MWNRHIYIWSLLNLTVWNRHVCDPFWIWQCETDMYIISLALWNPFWCCETDTWSVLILCNRHIPFDTVKHIHDPVWHSGTDVNRYEIPFVTMGHNMWYFDTETDMDLFWHCETVRRFFWHCETVRRSLLTLWNSRYQQSKMWWKLIRM